jgi:hypothetical protein
LRCSDAGRSGYLAITIDIAFFTTESGADFI